jgi:hypothetical protein
VLKSLNKSKDNFKAALRQKQGDLALIPCVNYIKDKLKGPFIKCVIFKGFFNKVYYNC